MPKTIAKVGHGVGSGEGVLSDCFVPFWEVQAGKFRLESLKRRPNQTIILSSNELFFSNILLKQYYL